MSTEYVNDDVVSDEVHDCVIDNVDNENIEEDSSNNVTEEANSQDEKNNTEDEISKLNKKINELNDSLLRTAAEFDNFKKRTEKEKSQIYSNAATNTIKEFLDVFDSLEKAGEICEKQPDHDVSKGIILTINQYKKAFEKLNITEINPLNDIFDPSMHNAVMHIEDDKYAANIVCEVFQKGYKINDNVIRFAMVKVAN